MDEREVRRIIKRLIMSLNATRSMDRRERRQDIAFAVFFCAMALVVPMVLCPVLDAFVGLPVALAVLALCWALAFGMGLWNRWRVLRGFYLVHDVAAHTQLVRVERPPLPAPLDDFVLALPARSPEILSFEYNWLLRCGAVHKETPLTVYLVRAAALSSRCPDHNLIDDAELYCIPLASLDVNEENAERFAGESRIVSAVMLDCRIEEQRRREGRSREARAADSYFDGKGRPLA